MSTEVISQPSTTRRGGPKLAWGVLATVVVVGVVGALVVALSSGGASGGHHVAEPPPVVRAETSPECHVDLDYLAAEIGTMPETVRPGVIAGLSPQMRQLVDATIASQNATGAAALTYGFEYSPFVPDGPALARTLATIPAADARAILNGLSQERRAEFGASSLAAAPAEVCP